MITFFCNCHFCFYNTRFSVDLDRPFLEFASKVSLAQAQECMYQAAQQEASSDFKLAPGEAAAVHEHYACALKLLNVDKLAGLFVCLVFLFYFLFFIGVILCYFTVAGN